MTSKPAQYDINTLLSQATDIVINAGNILLTYFNSKQNIHFKSLFDMVTEADIASEKFVINELRKLTPNIRILAEESASNVLSSVKTSDHIWILDPLDGTTNFAHGFPHFAISLGLLQHQIPMLGIVYDPLKSECFTAVRSQGAFLNSRPIRVSGTNDLEKSLVATGFPYTIRDTEHNNLVEFCTFRLACQGIRRFGAAALDLAYVAANRLDGFWEHGLKPWDTAAGILLVSEAGGQVSRYDGSQYSVTDPDLIASNGLVHLDMQHILTMKLPKLPELPRLSK